MTRLEIGSAVSCSDGPCGKLITLVVNPLSRAVTHLVVEPAHRWGLGRLVPIDLVIVDESADAQEDIVLQCTRAQFDELDMAEETQFVTAAGADWGVDGQVMLWPYYALNAGSSAVLRDYGGNAPVPITYDTLPPGEVAVRRGERVHATDGEVGRVHGLIIDPGNGHVSHVLVKAGHLFGREEMAIPIGNVENVENGVQLNVTKDHILDLPHVDLDPGSDS